MAPELERLLDDDRWIRRLARGLVRDAGVAEDLAQSTWVAALEARGSGPVPRPWLRRVLENAWRDGLRRGARSTARERAVARPEAQAGADELVAELELRERVARALRALAEPQRSTLVRHFLRDESLSAIARKDGLAVATVHERVQRGLAELRRRLDAEHGGERKAWVLALGALAERPTIPFGPFEIATMTAGLKTAVAAVALVGAGAWWWTSVRTGAAPERADFPVAETPVVEPATSAVAGVAVPAPRVELAREPEPVLAPEAEPRSFGRVLDTSGAPVAGVEIAIVGRDERPTSAADGSFSFAQEGEALPRLSCDDAGYVTLVAGGLRAGEQLVLVAPPADFAGVVVDEEGTPLAGAKLAFHLRESLFRTLGMQIAAAAVSEAWSATSDAQGRFTLARIAGGEHVGLEVRAAGYRPLDFDLPSASDGALRVVLARDAGELLLSGWVLGPRREPFEGARVSAGGEFVTSGADGSFSLAAPGETGVYFEDGDGVWRPEVSERVRLTAISPGLAPATLEFARVEVQEELVLVLEGEPLAISGVVRDPEGRGLAGVVVWPRELTEFASVPRGLEGLDRELTVEEELCATSPGTLGVVTEADGSFTLGCLDARDYELEFFEARSATHLVVPEVAAGTRELAVVLAPEPSLRRVAGRVIDSRGAPRAGVRIRPRRTRADESWVIPPLLVGGEFERESDGDGRFVFELLATASTLLDVHTMPPLWISLANQADLEAIEIVVPILCELQVLLEDPALADSLGVLDAQGLALEVIERLHLDGQSMGFSMGGRAEFSDGRTGMIQVPETARSLVLFLGDVRVLERPLTLDPEQPTVLRY